MMRVPLRSTPPVLKPLTSRLRGIYGDRFKSLAWLYDAPVVGLTGQIDDATIRRLDKFSADNPELGEVYIRSTDR
jgi:hypothetical protein